MEKGLFCTYSASNGIICLKYDITKNEISTIMSLNLGCSISSVTLFANYFYETDNFVVGCLGYSSNFFFIQLSNEFSYSQPYENINNIIPSGLTLARINIILPSAQTKYNVFLSAKNYNNICNTYQLEVNININITNEYPINTQSPSILICDNYYNYDKTGCIDVIEDGYYCNDTSNKTIDKCHDNCKTCNGGPSENNNNCTTCPTDIYFDLGNCISGCINGYFIDNGINKCKCSTNITCEFCSEESKSHNLCVTCNEDYYPKMNDANNIDNDIGIFINCYNDLTISDNYYLNSISRQYEPCHSNCIKCSGGGTDRDNNCTICKEGYSLIKNKENIINCYSFCNYYYYFDDDNIYHCTDNSICPPGFKLIDGKRKCIDSCINDDIYNYNFEYNNICYETCPEDTNISNSNTNLCELNCKKNNKFFNYERTECIPEVPEGFYCSNSDINTIEKCHSNCKTCDKGPTEFNNNCETCKDEITIFFDLGNCTDNCVNGDFVEDSVKKCKCTSNKKCYYCSEESKNLDLCVSCNEGYYKMKDDQSNQDPYFNCYNNETIPENYYLNITNNQYEPCQINCKKCEEEGNDFENKCTECKLGYSFIMNNNNISNCYEDCNK